MKFLFKSTCYFLLSVCAMGWKASYAAEDFSVWKDSFYQEAIHAGISKDILDKYVPRMTLLPRVIKLDMSKPEYLQNFFDYTRVRVSDHRIARGQKMLQKYKTWLKRVSDQYGVPPAYLVALWGMETNYGSYMGNVDMLNSLSTLAYHPRRRRFFTGELIAYFKILENEPSVAPEKGSWDGGFGNFQFMPTTFLAYAVDGDNNGRRDIVRNMPDAFSSAANYLSRMGWNKDEPWGREVVFPEYPDWEQIHQYETKTVREWQKLGIYPKYIDTFPESELKTKAQLRMPMGISGPVFLTYPNFKIIMRWNKMELYALSVGILADILQNNMPRVEVPADFIPFKTTSIIRMQEELTKRGYDAGGADGKIGSKTRKAIRAFQKDNRMAQDGYPSIELLKKLECYDE